MAGYEFVRENPEELEGLASPDVQERVEAIRAYCNRTNAFANAIGLKITRMEEGYAEAEMDVDESMLNPNHALHGGCMYTAADIAAGAASCSYGDRVTTVNSSISYLRPGLHVKKLRACGRVIKNGHSIQTIHVEVMDQDGVVLCDGLFTYMKLHLK